ncbi:hypothetical protein [Actinomadura violacea]|uniref:C2H2-type domain-containing protein n=1 Tax=Actinomadura violacea TaxID=2819934 RepID=A0ABS3RY62_9ACTN|nr:hypothetical protein [Actinomadura violacea]MBO2461692.1 hypothetical protein [Actinomadura violacea]
MSGGAYQEDDADPFLAVTGYGTAVAVAECPVCFALVRAGRLDDHQGWHDRLETR